MDKYIKKLTSSDVSSKENTLWYTVGSLTSSASSMLILLFVTRIVGVDEAGVFSIAWATSQLMLTIGWYSMRQFQISDVKKVFSFSDYFTAKIITSILMMIVGSIYCLILKFNFYKVEITLLLCGLMVTEVLADVFGAFFQQIGKLHISGKSNFVRVILYNCVFLLILFFTRKLNVSIVFATLSALLWLVFFDFRIVKELKEKFISFRFDKIFRLLILCFPLFIGSFMTTFIVNIPKNTIDLIMGNDVQTCYNIIFMPSSVINMFSMFIIVPSFNSIAILWHKSNLRPFFKKIILLILISLGLTICVVIGGYLLGIPILSLVYNVNLTSYKGTLIILLVAGGFNSINFIFNYLITVMRKQFFIICIYAITSVFAQFIVLNLVQLYGVNGAAFTYLLSMMMIMVQYFVILGYYFVKRLKTRGEIGNG